MKGKRTYEWINKNERKNLWMKERNNEGRNNEIKEKENMYEWM